MAVVIPFPTRFAQRRGSRAERVFQAQVEMERAQRQAKMMFGAAVLTTSLMALTLHLLAYVS